MSRYQYTEEDYRQIRESPSFLRVVEALGRVFGDGWRAQELATDGPPDFTIRIAVGPASAIAYVYASDTHSLGPNAWGPYGWIGIDVPFRGGRHIEFDGTAVVSIKEMVGTPEEQEEYRWGASGENIAKVEGYLKLLQRYLAALSS